MTQCTSHIFMVRPVAFGYNEETAITNHFQKKIIANGLQEKALLEFDNFVTLLQHHGIDVIILQDTIEPHTPDSIFPNNCISFQHNGTITLYPMQAQNRQAERLKYDIDIFAKKFNVAHVEDFTAFENESRLLEGTGSLVLDHTYRIAYACLSPRTNEELVQLFCQKNNYTPCLFHAVDEGGNAIYHTNVMMSVAQEFVVLCIDSIPNEAEQTNLLSTIAITGKKIIDISLRQMNHFAGNMLQLCNDKNERLTIMSLQAYNSLDNAQINLISESSTIVTAPLYTIETAGGGSARCMMAEIFLPLK